MDKVHAFLIFLEGKKVIIGSITFYIMSFLLGRHLIADDVGAMLTGILGTLGVVVAGISSTVSYQAALGATKIK